MTKPLKHLGKFIISSMLLSFFSLGVLTLTNAHRETKRVDAEDSLVYTLTPDIGENNSYTSEGNILVNGVLWTLEGNSQMLPWRLGGKAANSSTPLTVTRSLYSSTPINYSISKIELDFGKADNVTVNSLTVSIHSSAEDAKSGTNAIARDSPAFAPNSTVTLDISSFAQEGKYYRMSLNITINATSNKYVEFVEGRFYGSVGSSPVVDVTNKPTSNLSVGDRGTFIPTSSNITSPAYSFSSSHTNIIEINSSTGEYEVKKGGKAFISCRETGTSAFTSFAINVDYGLVSLADAVSIANESTLQQYTPKYKVTVTAYFINLNATSRNDKLSDKKVGETEATELVLYGLPTTHELRDKAILNGEVTITGFPSRYSSKPQLVFDSYSLYSDGAIEFAKKFNTDLASVCSNVNADNRAALTAPWNTLKVEYEALDSYAQAKLNNATHSDSDANIVEAIKLYDHIIARYSLENFMSRSNGASPLSNRIIDKNNNETVILISIIITLTSVTLIVGYLLIKRRKENN